MISVSTVSLQKFLARLTMLMAAMLVGGCVADGGSHTTTSMHHTGNRSMNHPPNLVTYSDRFASAGQPGSTYIRTLAARGVDVVINLAPPTAQGALEDESRLVTTAGMRYLNIAVDWNRPLQSEVDQFLDFMNENADQNVFLHCQMNMRASAYAFLHRVINMDAPPETAFADLQAVWIPNPTWTALINTALQRHDVAYAIPSGSP